MQILIVDDEEILRMDLKNALERVSPGNQYYLAESYDEAIAFVREQPLDIAFLDIQMPSKNGLLLAQEIKKTKPSLNIVMVTAYSNYAMDALKLYVSGYILKPVMDNDLIEVLQNLRNPIGLHSDTGKLETRCFGNFEVFKDGVPLAFKRKKAKEILAYLICLKGTTATKGEICEAIFENSNTPEKDNAYLKTLIYSLKRDLKRCGFENLLIVNNNAYSVDTRYLYCDYYNFLTGVADKASSYRGEFMNQYSWAEQYIFELENYY